MLKKAELPEGRKLGINAGNVGSAVMWKRNLEMECDN
jgi:hypothetical protein